MTDETNIDHVQPGVDRLLFEREAWARGASIVAGVDEVGRAAWAGPMVASAVILPHDFEPKGIRSSKKMDPGPRDRACQRILEEANAVAIWHVSAAEIDMRTIDVCHMELLRDVVNVLASTPDYILIDHYEVPGLQLPRRSIDNGDDLSASIAAASIVAKVICDRVMTSYDTLYPGYGFAQNKGYGTDQHRAALDELGPCPVHRRSVGPVAEQLTPQ